MELMVDISDTNNKAKFGTLAEILIKSSWIATLKGLENFVALTNLNCYGNQLSYLNITTTNITDIQHNLSCGAQREQDNTDKILN